jgi:hypothetical protein
VAPESIPRRFRDHPSNPSRFTLRKWGNNLTALVWANGSRIGNAVISARQSAQYAYVLTWIHATVAAGISPYPVP